MAISIATAYWYSKFLIAFFFKTCFSVGIMSQSERDPEVGDSNDANTNASTGNRKDQGSL